MSLPNNYYGRVARATASPVPRIVHRAEAFIRSHADQPIALHDVASAAGCSVRTLQLGFRQFRDMTPAAAIRQARLEAVQQALARGERDGTVTTVAHQYGFSNSGRFTRSTRQGSACRRWRPCAEASSTSASAEGRHGAKRFCALRQLLDLSGDFAICIDRHRRWR